MSEKDRGASLSPTRHPAGPRRHAAPTRDSTGTAVGGNAFQSAVQSFMSETAQAEPPAAPQPATFQIPSLGQYVRAQEGVSVAPLPSLPPSAEPTAAPSLLNQVRDPINLPFRPPQPQIRQIRPRHTSLGAEVPGSNLDSISRKDAQAHTLRGVRPLPSGTPLNAFGTSGLRLPQPVIESLPTAPSIHRNPARQGRPTVSPPRGSTRAFTRIDNRSLRRLNNSTLRGEQASSSSSGLDSESNGGATAAAAPLHVFREADSLSSPRRARVAESAAAPTPTNRLTRQRSSTVNTASAMGAMTRVNSARVGAAEAGAAEASAAGFDTCQVSTALSLPAQVANSSWKLLLLLLRTPHFDSVLLKPFCHNSYPLGTNTDCYWRSRIFQSRSKISTTLGFASPCPDSSLPHTGQVCAVGQ